MARSAGVVWSKKLVFLNNRPVCASYDASLYCLIGAATPPCPRRGLLRPQPLLKSLTRRFHSAQHQLGQLPNPQHRTSHKSTLKPVTKSQSGR